MPNPSSPPPRHPPAGAAGRDFRHRGRHVRVVLAPAAAGGGSCIGPAGAAGDAASEGAIITTTTISTTTALIAAQTGAVGRPWFRAWRWGHVRVRPSRAGRNGGRQRG